MTTSADLLQTRYSRQTLLPQLGAAGQRQLMLSSAALIGCGALGTVLADLLVRAGLGSLRIIDRDFVTIDNLPRQVLFDELDIAENLPKAEAATRKLRRINSGAEIEGVVADVNHRSISGVVRDVDLILDGTDNVETRYLINDAAVRFGIPWVYGACVGVEGRVLPIIPGETPCLRCIWDEPPPPGSLPTCDTAGVLNAAVHQVAARQAVEAIKILTGQIAALQRKLVELDVWQGTARALDVSAARTSDCPCCGRRQFDFLDGRRAAETIALCGRNAVQILPPADAGVVNLAALAARLPKNLRARVNRFMLRVEIDRHELTVFADGRCIVSGTTELAAARSLYAKWVGV